MLPCAVARSLTTGKPTGTRRRRRLDAVVRSRDAEAVRFAMAWGASSYPTDEVDATLQAAVRALRPHESSAADRA
ncbi:hypothetical protein [Agrococcus jenensis]|uniref:hypothetical protein n=1 Tax=Agrococcus jenensis TaxID=46353 RepID=UPI000F4B3BD4|nr:hypothetical protein [Agrococcus jenensis]